MQCLLLISASHRPDDHACVKHGKKHLGTSVWASQLQAVVQLARDACFMCVHYCGIAFTHSPALCNPQTIFERARHNRIIISKKCSFVYTQRVRGMTRSVRELLRCSNLLFLCPLKQTAP